MNKPIVSFETFARQLPPDVTVAAAFHLWNQSGRLPDEAVKALDEGDYVLAIKMVKEGMNGGRMGLREAKEIVDAAVADSVKWQVARNERNERRNRGEA